jgi:hypothetical protein
MTGQRAPGRRLRKALVPGYRTGVVLPSHATERLNTYLGGVNRHRYAVYDMPDASLTAMDSPPLYQANVALDLGQAGDWTGHPRQIDF